MEALAEKFMDTAWDRWWYSNGIQILDGPSNGWPTYHHGVGLAPTTPPTTLYHESKQP